MTYDRRSEQSGKDATDPFPMQSPQDFGAASVKAEAEPGQEYYKDEGFDLSEEQVDMQVDMLLGRVDVAAAFDEQRGSDETVYKVEEVKAEALPLTSSHFVKYRVHEGKHIKTWQCAICSKEFSHQYTLMRHLPTHTDERKYTCGVCGKAFRQMSTLSQHRAIHSAERPYVCEICDKTFNRVSTLISHRKTHTGQKPHQCHLCHKAFHQKGNLRNHIFTHTNERPYKCDVCNKGFNQMSNLMCHKLKAHQRSERPRYTCQICGKDFQKRIGLRNHEQCQHGFHNNDAGVTMIDTPRIRYTNGVVVEPIKTEAMQQALAINQTPFALLRPLNGIPVLVRVLPAGEKQMLVPATAEDLKKHGQISIIAKTNEEEGSATEVADPKEAKPMGTTVQIKIPVVATVIQRRGEDGNMCMMVQSPGPSPEGSASDTYIFNSTENEDMMDQSEENSMEVGGGDAVDNVVSGTQIEYLDEAGNIITEEQFSTTDTYFEEGFAFGDAQNDDHLQDGNVIQLEEENKENIMNLNNHTIIQMLGKVHNEVVETLVEITDKSAISNGNENYSQ